MHWLGCINIWCVHYIQLRLLPDSSIHTLTHIRINSRRQSKFWENGEKSKLITVGYVFIYLICKLHQRHIIILISHKCLTGISTRNVYLFNYHVVLRLINFSPISVFITLSSNTTWIWLQKTLTMPQYGFSDPKLNLKLQHTWFYEHVKKGDSNNIENYLFYYY